jgi:hypothetical protein
MLPSQGCTNVDSKLRVSTDFSRHYVEMLRSWSGSEGSFGLDFCVSLPKRCWVPIFSTSLDDIGACRPRCVETQASRADFKLTNASNFGT